MTRPLCIFLCDICALVCTSRPSFAFTVCFWLQIPKRFLSLGAPKFREWRSSRGSQPRALLFSFSPSNKDRRNVLAVQKSRNNSYNFYERALMAPSESMAYTGNIRGMKEGDGWLTFWKLLWNMSSFWAYNTGTYVNIGYWCHGVQIWSQKYSRL